MTNGNTGEISREVFGVDAGTLKPNQLSLLQTIAKTAEAWYECPGCSRKFRIKGAKRGGSYKCISCARVLSEIPAGMISSLRAEDAQVRCDAVIPANVKESVQSEENIYGRYVLCGRLGEGGMGSVHTAYDCELHRYVALKFIKSERAEELKHEAMILAGLEHRNIARIYDIGTANGRGYITMQLIDGRTIDNCKMSADDMMNAMISVCDGVSFAHKHGVIHRDIKPANIMVDDDGNVFVMDFGLASHDTGESEIAGTPGFIAPEILSGGAASELSDVYSIGATLYCLLAGTPPHMPKTGETLVSYIDRASTERHIELTQVRPEVSKEIGAIVERSLAPKEGRYQSIGDVAGDIERYLKGFPVRSYSNTVRYRASKFIHRNRTFVLIAAAIVCCCAVIGAAVAWNIEQGKKQAEEEARERQVEKDIALG